jgi:hypothetical protein
MKNNINKQKKKRLQWCIKGIIEEKEYEKKI